MGSKLSLCMGLSVAALAMSGCEDGTGLGASRPDATATAAADRPAATRLVERDVEAPDVFKKTEAGLWDGRPSLGGVWVAHPEAADPERVMIRNRANGQTVIGALFRRERDMPGPRFQVSSDAASALGMLAGAPADLDVTALRREEAPAAPAAEPADAPAAEADIAQAGTTEAGTTEPEEAPALAEAEPVETEALDPIQSAAAAIERAEAAGGEAVADAPAPEATLAQAETAAQTPAPTETSDRTEPEAQASAAPARERRGLFAGLFRRRPAEPLSALAPASAGAAAAGTVVSPEIADATPTPEPASARAPGASGQSFVQIGIFSVEGNARETAAVMRRNGVVPRIYEQQSQGQTFWRVVAGPANTRSDRAALLRKVKELGYTDAYAVAR